MCTFIKRQNNKFVGKKTITNHILTVLVLWCHIWLDKNVGLSITEYICCRYQHFKDPIFYAG